MAPLTPDPDFHYAPTPFNKAAFEKDILHDVQWRTGDVVISSYPKCGSNWMQNIVYQLLTRGDGALTNIRAEVPIIDYNTPTSDRRALLDLFASKNLGDGRRALKTHWPPPLLPVRDCVKYIIMVRDVYDLPVSMFNFINSYSDRMLEHRGHLKYNSVEDAMDSMDDFKQFFSFLNSWLAFQKYPNVKFVHFRDLKADLNGEIRDLAEFLEVDVSDPAVFEKICTQCSFEWMKAHEDVFEQLADGSGRLVSTGGLVSKGQVGQNKAALTPKLLKRVDEAVHRWMPDKEVQNWMRYGKSASIIEK